MSDCDDRPCNVCDLEQRTPDCKVNLAVCRLELRSDTYDQQPSISPQLVAFPTVVVRDRVAELKKTAPCQPEFQPATGGVPEQAARRASYGAIELKKTMDLKARQAATP